jgi:translocation and assembly module TamB
VLKIAGSYDAAADAAETLALTLKGDTVTVAGLPELTAAASPDLTLSLRGDKLKLRGTVDVPLARIELERLQSATRPSSDAVIVDAEEVDDGPGLALDSDVTVKLGDDVKLNGFGLKGQVTGQLAVRDRPGRATVARGGVEVTGSYKAYGQDLEITRGRLAYASTPLDDPALDIRAQRKLDEVTVGVQVRGTALAPELTLWSNPALDQAEQLSWLVLGRPLRSASQADGAQLTQAAAAIGGNLLAKRLGARMGLDEVGVADNRALGGAALTVGKYLSPKLYVSYGVALFGTGQVVTFKYLLSRVWSVQIDSGTENRAALNYRLER